MTSFTLVTFCSLLSWLSGACFYHTRLKQPVAVTSANMTKLFRPVGWTSLSLAFVLAIWQLSWEVGLFLQFFCASLLMFCSLFVASRWPVVHYWSMPVCVGLLVLTALVSAGGLV